ncbi:hypothetical protein T4B_6698 [Trichinella pseudospiralis]|uniref:Uncharacterized protein n=1 Tax=Trichinella pseudospiralis TaxID=6337 RepID=A0A0V1H0V8_TRIPS|nr:hypothetical protein T4B_6698 [Trichinella pseudospiralis]
MKSTESQRVKISVEWRHERSDGLVDFNWMPILRYAFLCIRMLSKHNNSDNFIRCTKSVSRLAHKAISSFFLCDTFNRSR